MKTGKSKLSMDLYAIGVAAAVSMIIGVIAAMTAAALIVNEVMSPECTEYLIVATLLIGLLGGSFVIREPVGGKRMVLCVGSGCVYYLGLLLLSCILGGTFSLGTGGFWLLMLGAGLFSGLCGKRRKGGGIKHIRK